MIKSRTKYAKEIRHASHCDMPKRCYITGEKKDVQLHHLIKVQDLSEIAYYNQIEDVRDLYVPTVYLTDRIHHVWHQLTEGLGDLDDVDISLDEAEKMLDLFSFIDFKKVPEEYLQEYTEYYDKMMNHYVFELENRFDLQIDHETLTLLKEEDYIEEE